MYDRTGNAVADSMPSMPPLGYHPEDHPDVSYFGNLSVRPPITSLFLSPSSFSRSLTHISYPSSSAASLTSLAYGLPFCNPLIRTLCLYLPVLHPLTTHPSSPRPPPPAPASPPQPPPPPSKQRNTTSTATTTPLPPPNATPTAKKRAK